MGMGSYNNHSKGNGNGSGGGGGGGNRGNGRSYGLMVVLAFGAALLGVLLLHKLRERRIFNLLLKEKDSDLLSLHHLMQKERDYTKELRRKNEEMKAKLYSIRTQKMELDRRISELKSTVGSLKEELQTMEAALEEKQSEIKVLRVNTDNGNPQVMDLLESLKRKEGEIEDLKHQLEDPVKVRSVSTDDPSKPLVNLTMSESVSGKEKTEVTEKKEGADRLQESTGNKDIADGNGNKSIGREDQIGNGERETDRRETNGGTKEDETITNTTGKDYGGSVTGAKETNLASAAETITNMTGKDVDHEVNDGKENKITRNEHVGNIEDSELGEKQKLYATPKGGDRRKKWRLVARTRRLENRGNLKNEGVGNVRSRKFFKDDQVGLMGREDEAGSNRRLTGDNHPINSSDGKGLELQNSENTEEPKNKLACVNTSEATGKFGSVTHNNRKQTVEVGKSEEDEARNIQQNLKNRDATKLEDRDEEMSAADPQDLPGDLEVADAEEQETDVTDDNIFDESGSSLEEDKEEYREEIDESEF